MYMFMQNFIELSAAVHELSYVQKKTTKTYDPSLPRTVKIIFLLKNINSSTIKTKRNVH